MSSGDNLTTLFSKSLYLSPICGQVVTRLFFRKCNGNPATLTQPICFDGLPVTSAKGKTSFVTTEPAPIRAYSPISTPQMIVAFAPIVAPFLTTVFLNSAFLFRKLLGLITLVKTIEGPRKTSSSIVTPSYKETLFCIFTLLPTTTFRSTKTFWPRLLFSPISHPGIRWQKCHMYTPAAIMEPSSTALEG